MTTAPDPKPATDEELAQWMRQIRARTGLSQEEFGASVGVTKGAVSQWETGKVVPRLAIVRAIGTQFGVSVLSAVPADNAASALRVGSPTGGNAATVFVPSAGTVANVDNAGATPLSAEERGLIEMLRQLPDGWPRELIRFLKEISEKGASAGQRRTVAGRPKGAKKKRSKNDPRQVDQEPQGHATGHRRNTSRTR